jgi:hypothetical protein
VRSFRGVHLHNGWADIDVALGLRSHAREAIATQTPSSLDARGLNGRLGSL